MEKRISIDDHQMEYILEKLDFLETDNNRLKKKTLIGEIDKPLISVITPFFNASTYFEQTYNSVINQTFPWFEWIIVDDGSDEDNRNYINQYSDKDSRIRIVRQENGGLAAARNAGVKNSRTELLFPLDADDLIAENCLEILFWALKTNPDASWAYCDVAGFQDMQYIWKRKFNAATMKKENFLVATALIKKSAFYEIGGYKVEKCSYNEDWRFWLEMLSKHKFPVHVNEVLFGYRRHDSMLADVVRDEAKIEFNKKIINEAQKNVDTSVTAIEYPINDDPKIFDGLKYENWDCSISNELDSTGKETKLLWIIPWMNVGGADKFNIQAMTGLKKEGFINYVATTISSDNPWEEEFLKISDEIFDMPNFLSRYKYPEFISYLIQSRKIDCLVVSNSEDGYWMLPWIRQHHPDLPIIDYVHMEEWYWHGGGHARTSSMVRGIVDKTLVCNTATERVMVDKLNATNVDTLHIGVDDSFFNKEKVEKGFLHNKLHISSDKKIILFPCRICGQKRPFLMLEIAQNLLEKYNNVVFVVVGDGPDLPELKKQIIKRGLEKSVYCIGVCKNMRACYRDSSMVLVCSLKEGLTLTTYEALSMGVPVISSDVGGQSDLVKNSVGGLIPFEGNESCINLKNNYTVNEVNNFVNRIIMLLSDEKLYKSVSETARKEIENNFSINIMVEKFSKCILETIDCSDRIEKDKLVAEGLNITNNLADDYYTTHVRWNLEEIHVNQVGFLGRLRRKLTGVHLLRKTIKIILRK